MRPNVSLNRRQFLKHTTAATVAATALPAAFSLATADKPRTLSETKERSGGPKIQRLRQEPDKSGPWKFCAFEKPLLFLNYDDTADVFAELGFDGLEAAVRPGGHVLPERVEEDLPKFVEALKKRGLEITILTSGISAADQPHTEKVLRTAAKLGIKRYRMDWWHYDLRQPIQSQLDALRPRLNELAALNRSLGVTGLYQNHAGANMVGAALWDIYSLVREHDPKDVALAFDIRHATVEGGLSWPVQFHLVKSHVGAACFKDFLWDDDKVKSVPLGAGRVDKKYAPMLTASGFVGPISLHVEYGEGSNDKKLFAEAFRKDFATLRAWLKPA